MPRVALYRRSKLLREYALSPSQIAVVGKHPTCDIVLPDASSKASGYHAALVPRVLDRRHFVRDLASQQGTCVGGQRVDRHLLRDGDAIEIGGYTLVFSKTSPAIPGKNAFLRLVSNRDADCGEPAGGSHGRTDRFHGERLAFQRVELLDHLSRARANGSDLRTVLDGIGPVLVKIMRADRGFIRLFSDEPGSGEDLGISGLDAADSIGITESAFMERLLAGRYVRDGSTLLVPIICMHRTVGFFCLDRHRAPRPFTDEEGHFLIGVGQASMTLRDVPTALVKRESSGPLSWTEHLVGRSPAMQKVLAEIRDAAKSDANVLLSGEPGCGHELAARAIWRQARPEGPFIAKNCGRTDRWVSETELFGHAPHASLWNADPEGAAGWFELAHGGTLFLDEIQNLSAATQRKVLRVLGERESWRYAASAPTPVDVRVIAGTSTLDLERAIDQDRLQKALYHQFRRIRIPPLRERPEDIPLLAFYFLDRAADALGARTRTISRKALEMLSAHNWPGNVRELEQKMLEAVARNNDVLISLDLDVPADPAQRSLSSASERRQSSASGAVHRTTRRITMGGDARRAVAN